jgi:poly [ADP-ribose] polymerase 1
VAKLDKNFISKSTLPVPIQDIIRLIFDIETMKRQMVEFEIDLNKMPLGKISAKQIKQAFQVLNEIQTLIDNKGSNNLFLDASNRFYTLIPHDFGLKKPTLLNDPALVKAKTDMLNNLLDIEIAYNILNLDSGGEVDPIDAHYKKLECSMETLDHDSEEYKRLLEYVKNTHAQTHSNYKLNVKEILKLNRKGEVDRYEAFKSLHNRKLLWHGSRLTNFAGILSQGLRIAPPEAPCTGYMFGKGVYFADMVSKSANYCFTSSANPTGLMLLCEVACGEMYERNGAEYVTKLPSGKHSTKGCGRTAPDPKHSYVTSDGVEIPLGKGIDCGIGYSSLLYNEYIVYDVSQVRMKYLLKVEFDYSY